MSDTEVIANAQYWTAANALLDAEKELVLARRHDGLCKVAAREAEFALVKAITHQESAYSNLKNALYNAGVSQP